MRLILKKDGNIINEFRYDKGPVYIGRAVHSQIHLPNLAVSRQHAVLFTSQDGKWILEDMDSANKTYLNGREIRKIEVKTGDSILIADFSIEIDLETETSDNLHLEDTLIPPNQQPSAQARGGRDIIIRNPNSEHGPDIRLPAGRIKDFLQATEAICSANGPDELLNALLDITIHQFNASQAWCALRNVTEGPMTSQAGRGRDGNSLEPKDITINMKITEAIDRSEFLLIQQLPQSAYGAKSCSAIIAPIIDPTGCFGVMYLESSPQGEPYGLSDMDYLMLLAIHIAAILENF
jgi:hypothetical protein